MFSFLLKSIFLTRSSVLCSLPLELLGRHSGCFVCHSPELELLEPGLAKVVASCERRGLDNSGSHNLSLTFFHFLLERLKAVTSLTEK